MKFIVNQNMEIEGMKKVYQEKETKIRIAIIIQTKACLEL